MNNLYEALEACLHDIEQGADVETVLVRYPDLAGELRPILEASASAKSMAAPAPSTEVVRRNRAKVLGRAAQMREAKARSSQRIWFVSLRRIAVTLAVLTVLFVSGTGLVGAASDTLPGDNLYPVKRTWEGIRLFFTFNSQVREALEIEHENKRLHELWELLGQGRSEEVDFKGRVTSQNGNEWVVAGVRVLIDNQTEIRNQGIEVGSAVRVRGTTHGDDTVLAERIRLLDPDAKLPDDDDEHESEDDNENNSGSVTGDEKPRFEPTSTPESDNSNSGSDDSDADDNHNDNDSDDNSNSSGDDGDSNGNDDDNDNDDSSNDNNDDRGGDDNDDDDDDSGGGDNSGSDDDDDDGDDD